MCSNWDSTAQWNLYTLVDYIFACVLNVCLEGFALPTIFQWVFGLAYILLFFSLKYLRGKMCLKFYSQSVLIARLGRSCKRSCNCVQLLTQLHFLSTILNAMSSHLTTPTLTATAFLIKPTTASVTADDRFQPGTTTSTTATAAHKSSTTATVSAYGDFRPGTTASTTANDCLKQPQLQLRAQRVILGQA